MVFRSVQLQNQIKKYIPKSTVPMPVTPKPKPAPIQYSAPRPVQPQTQVKIPSIPQSQQWHPSTGTGVDINNFPRIQKLQAKGYDKSEIVKALAGRGNADQLGANQLRAIGFGDTFINNKLGGGPAKPPVAGGGNPKPAGPPSLDKYLAGDETYLSQQSMLQKALDDYMVMNNMQQGRLNEDFDIATGRLGEEKVKALKDNTEDFGSRGILHSGLFTNSVTEYNDQFQDLIEDLTRDKSRGLEDLLNELGMFTSETELQRELAKQEAIRRRAEELSIGLGGVAGGSTSKPKPKPKPAAKPYAGIIRPNKDSQMMQDALKNGKVSDKEMAAIKKQVARSKEAGTLSAKDKALLAKLRKKRT